MSDFLSQVEKEKQAYLNRNAAKQIVGEASISEMVSQICKYVENGVLNNLKEGKVLTRKVETRKLFSISESVVTYAYANVAIYFSQGTTNTIYYTPYGESDHSDFFSVSVKNVGEAKTIIKMIIDKLQDENIELYKKDAFLYKLKDRKAMYEFNDRLHFCYDIK